MANFTKQAIKVSFLKLLNQQPLHKITVRDIVSDCGINRNSFYYHYQDIPALIEDIVTEMAENLIQEYPTIDSLDQCFEVAFRLAQDNRRAALHIFDSSNRNVFTKNAMRLCEHVVTRYLDTVFPDSPISEADRKAVIRYLKCHLYGMFIDWVSNSMQEDAYIEIKRILEITKDVPELIIARSCEKK